MAEGWRLCTQEHRLCIATQKIWEGRQLIKENLTEAQCCFGRGGRNYNTQKELIKTETRSTSSLTPMRFFTCSFYFLLGRREREKSESSVLSSPRVHSRVALGSATCHSRRKRNILFTKLTAWNLCVPSGPQTPPLAVRGTQPPTQPHVLCTLDGWGRGFFESLDFSLSLCPVNYCCTFLRCMSLLEPIICPAQSCWPCFRPLWEMNSAEREDSINGLFLY